MNRQTLSANLGDRTCEARNCIHFSAALSEHLGCCSPVVLTSGLECQGLLKGRAEPGTREYVSCCELCLSAKHARSLWLRPLDYSDPFCARQLGAGAVPRWVFGLAGSLRSLAGALGCCQQLQSTAVARKSEHRVWVLWGRLSAILGFREGGVVMFHLLGCC